MSVGRLTVRTPEIEEAFIEALSSIGSVTHAAKHVGISRNSLYQWRAEDPDFADRWDIAVTRGLDRVEDKAFEMADSGSERLVVFLLERRRSERYMPRQAVDYNTNVTVELRRAPIEDLQAELRGLLAMAQAGTSKIIDLDQSVAASPALIPHESGSGTD